MDGARKLILVSPTRVNRVVAQPKPEPAGDETLADFTVSTTAD
jgi:hypothetical protein